MPKMTEDDLLAVLRTEEEQSTAYTTGQLAAERAQAYSEYLRLPYGNEEEGRSSVVSSDVLDTVEGMLPDLIDVFVSSDKAVQFDPTSEEDDEGAKQATDACNYVFYRQNNGFLVLYTALKDALLMKTGAIKWTWEEKRQATFTTYKMDEMQLAVYLMTNPDATIDEKEEIEPTPEELMQYQQAAQQLAAVGQIAPELPKRYQVKIKTVEKKGRVALYNVPADELRVSVRHNSILLDNCPYVAHVTKRTLSDIREMGYDVDEEDVNAASDESISVDRELRESIETDGLSYRGNLMEDRSDAAMVEGWLKEEYVLVDFDGDGIAERRCIMRLGDKILSNTEVSHIPIAAWTPYILTHRFYGMSVAEFVSDIQRIKTEILRQTLDNLYFANNQRVRVQTDSQGNPLANIDDLLNSRPGGIVREQVAGAVQPFEQPWIGASVLPMVELMDSTKENRTGFTRYNQGLDADSLNQTKGGMQMIMNSAQKRMKLMARIAAECLVAPTFRGIFKTLTDYCMDKLAFRLRNEYVQYDPQEWRDGYDMVINVGLGTGDKEQNFTYLMQIANAQKEMIAGGGMGTLVTPKNVYNTQARMVEAAGFKSVAEFFTDPGDGPPPPPAPPQPSPDAMVLQQTEIEKAKIKAETDLQIAREKIQSEERIKLAQLQLDQNKHIDDTLLKQQEIDHKASQTAHPFPNFPQN